MRYTSILPQSTIGKFILVEVLILFDVAIDNQQSTYNLTINIIKEDDKRNAGDNVPFALSVCMP